jgi:osmotically inducible protein OsmC
MPERHAEATWNGNLRDGSGHMNMESGSYEGAYTFASRFEEDEGTNPEELIAAAHAGCFSMALAADLGREGYDPEAVDTTANVTLDGDEGAIVRIELVTEASVPGISNDEFQEIAAGAKQNCPVSKALAGVDEITLDATLAS